MKLTIDERLKRAEKRALPLDKKYSLMSLDEKLKYIRENRAQWKKDQNILKRYSNLLGRSVGRIN